jgi:hypothetical protein
VAAAPIHIILSHNAFILRLIGLLILISGIVLLFSVHVTMRQVSKQESQGAQTNFFWKSFSSIGSE